MSGSNPSRGRRLAVLAATVASMALAAGLGAWQLDRAAQKEAQRRWFDERSALPALDASELMLRGDATGQIHRRVRLAGHWLGDHTVFLDNRQMNRRFGFVVVTPLKLADSNGIVVVQRGWVPRDAADRTRLPSVPTPSGRIAIEGRIAPPPARLYDFGAASSGPIRQNLDLARYAQEIGEPLAALSVMQLSGPDDGLSRQWPRPAVDIHKHYGYAFQWFALCALMAGLYVWYRIIRPRLRLSD